MKSWKLALAGIIALVIMCACIFASPIIAVDLPETTSSEPTVSNTMTDPTLEPTIMPSLTVPPLVFYPRPEMPTEPIANPKPPVPGIIDGDFVTVEVKLYNDHQEGFNPVDGAEYLADIAELFAKHAPEGLRISAGCAMSYTEGGSGKQGVYSRTNNCFGIRATPGWEGWVFARNTGKVYINWETALKHGGDDMFRAYPTIEDSVKDYIAHMCNNRYNAVLGMDNDVDYFKHVLNMGYGESHMIDTWLYIVDLYDLTKYNV